MRALDRLRIHLNQVMMSLFASLTVALMVTNVALASESDASDVSDIDVVFVLDNSGSMRKNDPDFLTRTAVLNFANALSAESGSRGRIAIVLFDGHARLIQALTPIEKNHAQSLLAAPLAALDFSGQRTDSPSGIERAIYELGKNGRPGAQKAIILLTDGRIDTGSRQRDLEAGRWLRGDLADQSQTEGIRIFGVAFTEAADYRLMQALALKTRARYYRAFEAAELDSVVADVLARIAASPEIPVSAADVNSSAGLSSPPRVGAARSDDAGNAPFEFRGWLPVVILLIAGSLLWRRRKGSAEKLDGPREADSKGTEIPAPVAQLLDPQGHLGRLGGIVTLSTRRTTLGRDPKNDLVLDNDAVSSEHAAIEVRNGRYWLEDLRSTNGTRIGGTRIQSGKPVQLKGGDHIRFGEVDLMFALVGYVPGGATVFLESTRSEDQSADPENTASGGESGGSSERPESNTSGGRSHISLLPSLEEAPPTEKEFDGADSDANDPRRNRIESLDPSPTTGNSVIPIPHPRERPAHAAENPLRSCIDFHLARVGEISPALADFVEHAFDPDMRAALAIAGSDLIEAAIASNSLQQKTYTANRIRYLTCAVPVSLDRARDAFGKACGGFTRLLTEALQEESFLRERCEVLVVLTFGRPEKADAPPWVSLSVVPDEGQDPRIDLLSYEFLTDAERREIDPDESQDVGHSTRS